MSEDFAEVAHIKKQVSELESIMKFAFSRSVEKKKGIQQNSAGLIQGAMTSKLLPQVCKNCLFSFLFSFPFFFFVFVFVVVFFLYW